MLHLFVYQCHLTSGSNVAVVFLNEVLCHCSYKVDCLECIQWKCTQVSDTYRLQKRIQLLNRQKSPKGSMSLSSVQVLLVSLSDFSGAFNLLVAGQKFLCRRFLGSWRLSLLSLGRPHFMQKNKMEPKILAPLCFHCMYLANFDVQEHSESNPCDKCRFILCFCSGLNYQTVLIIRIMVLETRLTFFKLGEFTSSLAISAFPNPVAFKWTLTSTKSNFLAY